MPRRHRSRHRLGPFTGAQMQDGTALEAAKQAIVEADAVDPNLLTAIRMGAVDDGRTIELPAFCLTCGYVEVPGADFMKHECVEWRRATEPEREENMALHFAETLRRLRQ